MFIYFLLLINLIEKITEENHEKYIVLSDFLNTLNSVKNNFGPSPKGKQNNFFFLRNQIYVIKLKRKIIKNVIFKLKL